MSQEKYRKKKRVMINVSDNLYNAYKKKYNFSRILNEVLSDFLSNDLPIDPMEIIKPDKIQMRTDEGNIYIVDAVAYEDYIKFLMDISKR